MPTPSNTPTSQSVSRHILVILSIAVFITAMALIILQNVLGTGAPKILKSYQQGYRDGFNTARQQATSLSPAATRTQIPNAHLSGTVTAVSGEGFTLSVQGLLLDRAVDGVDTTRSVRVTSNTEVIELTPVDREVFESQQAAFRANASTGDPSIAPPSPFEETVISFSDLAEGDQVTVSGAEGEDLTRMNPITAVRVVRIVVPTPIIPEVLPPSEEPNVE